MGESELPLPIDGGTDGGFTVGDVVRCERAEPPHGTWLHYAGRLGRVALIQRKQFASGRVYVEIGVCWDMNPDRHGQADSWFLPSELVKVGHSRSTAGTSDARRVYGSRRDGLDREPPRRIGPNDPQAA
jgi:hypothetical protein